MLQPVFVLADHEEPFLEDVDGIGAIRVAGVDHALPFPAVEWKRQENEPVLIRQLASTSLAISRRYSLSIGCFGFGFIR